TALPDREALLARVPAEHRTARVDDLALARAVSVPAQEGVAVVTREEAEVLALRPVGHGEPCGARPCADRGLLELAEREPESLELRGTKPGQHVGLVFGRVGGGPQQRATLVVGEPRVVAG